MGSNPYCDHFYNNLRQIQQTTKCIFVTSWKNFLKICSIKNATGMTTNTYNILLHILQSKIERNDPMSDCNLVLLQRKKVIRLQDPHFNILTPNALFFSSSFIKHERQGC